MMALNLFHILRRPLLVIDVIFLQSLSQRLSRFDNNCVSFINADRSPTCCHQSESVFVSEHSSRGLNSTGYQLVVLWLYFSKTGSLLSKNVNIYVDNKRNVIFNHLSQFNCRVITDGSVVSHLCYCH